MRRALLAYFAFSSVEWAVWIVVLVYARGQGTASTVGLVAVAQLVPAALLAPSLASLVDRLPRSVAPLFAYGVVAASLAATAMAMLAGASFWMVVGAAVTTNVLVGLARPAHHSLTPCLASGPSELVAANVVTTASEGLGLFLGPAVVGIAMSLWSTGAALMVCVGILVIAMALTAGLSTTRLTLPSDGEHVDDGLRAGMRSFRSNRPSRMPILIGGVQGIVEGAVDVLIVLLAIDVLALGEGGAGYLNSLVGVGAIVGGLASSLLVGRSRLSPPMVISGLLTGGAMILIGVLPAAALFLAVAGIGYSVTAVASRTLLQRLSPVSAVGRMFGILESVTLVGLAIGAVLAPLVADWLGVEVAFAVFGGVLPVALVLTWPRLRVADAAGSVPLHTVRALQGVEAVAGLDPDALEAMARGARVLDAQPDQPVVVEGETGTEMYVIDSGALEVTREGRKVAILAPGDIFGEIALLEESPRIATVTATEPTVLVAVTREGFRAALSTDPGFRHAVEVLAAARRTETLGGDDSRDAAST